jgi:hypothetical protein
MWQRAWTLLPPLPLPPLRCQGSSRGGGAQPLPQQQAPALALPSARPAACCRLQRAAPSSGSSSSSSSPRGTSSALRLLLRLLLPGLLQRLRPSWTCGRVAC